MAVVAAACMGKQACSLDASCSTFKERLENPGAFCWDIKKRLAVKVTCKKKSAVLAAPKSPPQLPPCTPSGPRPCTPSGPSSWFLADFGKELTGGMVLEVKNGKAGQTVDITCGESLSGDAVGSNWGWVQQWTLRDGAQTLTQHKYMECRFVTVAFSGTMDLSGFTLSAWKTHYPYYDSDSQFTSSNATLNAVYELSRYTLEAASLDTYTDSNTRERRPYEADGIIAASARMLVQRDVLWPRHSHAWVMNDPTWPVEWKQISPFLGWQDYMATGTPELSLAFMDQMHDRTMLKFLDETGTLATNKMGRHIVDWMPDTPTSSGERDETVGLGEFTASNHMSVSNGFAAQGLNLLSKMVAAGGRADNATTFAAESASLMKNMRDKMFNGSNWCDGICSEVKGASLMMSNMFMLCFGMTPTANVDSAWKIVADWGLEKIGDYGAFWYLMAIAGGYYADDEYDIPDDGTAVITALTKCDRYSWCSGLRDDNLTMTRESWHEGTYSHEWGTSPIVGVVWGVLGVHQTAPGWANFTVKPKIGSLKHVTATVPSIRGFINVTARPGAVEVGVPCNAHATLCVPRSAQEQGALFTPESHQLLLDGREVPAIATGGHLCAAQTLGCGAGGLARHLSAQQRGD
jgi:alpha-L-rhamnosidase